jgi:hypothetical protein
MPTSSSSSSAAPNSRRFKSNATSSTAKATPYNCSSAKGPDSGKRVRCKVEYKMVAMTKPRFLRIIHLPLAVAIWKPTRMLFSMLGHATEFFQS